MVKVSNRAEKIRKKIELREYKATEALKLLKETATAKFNESAEVHISLKLDTKYADQQLRTTIILPKGTGKKVRIAVIAEGDKISEALSAGADIAGGQDLIQDIMKGMLDFDRLIATPDLMPSIAKLGKLEYRADKAGVVHMPFGKADFNVEDLLANLETIQESIDKNRPSGVKGKYWRSFYICSTMGPSIQLDINDFRDKVFS